MDELKVLLAASRAAVAGGRSPLAVAEEFFEGAVTPVSKLRDQVPLSAEADAAILEAVHALMEWGAVLFAADRNATRSLDRILSWAKHLAGAKSREPELARLFDNAYQDWHWHGW